MSFLDRFRASPAKKAVYGGPALVAYQNGIPLSVAGLDWQQRAKAYLDAYRVGWFYKAESRISRDLANLAWSLAYEDDEGDNAEEITAPASNVPWERLDPLEQFLRLSERPNPWQTGRQFKQQQMIRLDFTGRGLVYMENGEGTGLPTAFFGINPCRMWPSYNARGELIGWVLDKDKAGGGTPFTRDEILVLEYPGTDVEPQGVVEAVYANVPLTRQLPQHASDVLSTGGRLAGMAWPKDRALDEAEFQDAQRAWRNVTSDPNAARRLLLFPEPMEYVAGAATPSEIGMPELAEMSRDEILTAFPIAPEMLMVPMASGLNSGETQVRVEERYWEGTMHPRVEVWEDAFQQYLLPRYEAAIGRPLDFDILEPNRDNAASLTEKAEAYKALVSIGFDPKEAVAAVGLDHIPWMGLPDLLDPAKQLEREETAAEAQGTAQLTQLDKPTKALTRDDSIGREQPGFQQAMREFLAIQQTRVIEQLEATLPKDKAARMKALPGGWWDKAAEDRALRVHLRRYYESLGRDALQVVVENTDRILAGKRADRILDDTLRRAGLRITDINETTRKTIADTLTEGVRRGYSIAQLTGGVPGEGYGGVRGALMANGVNVWDDLRAETIARTETMLAYNEAALLGYKDLDVYRVEAIDGDEDTECADRHGQVFSVDEALSITDHPNGTLDWVPLNGKSVDVGTPAIVQNFYSGEAAMKAVDPPTVSLVPDFTPVIERLDALETSIRNLPPPNLTVSAPDVTVKAEPLVIIPKVQDVRIVESTLPAKKRVVQRDLMGRITSVTDQ